VNHKEMSKKGGQVKSEKKTAAARKNAARTRGKWATAIAYEYISTTDGERRFGSQIVMGKPPHDIIKMNEWATDIIEKQTGNRAHPIDSFLELSTTSMLVR